ncbi:DUF5615 family PIN-like protein [Ekhidna sp.]
MKFIIDENLSPELVELFKSEHLEAYHVNDMKSHQKRRIIDDQLRRLAIRKGYIIVTKDDDFVKSFVDRKIPEKLIYVFGLDTKEDLMSRFKEIITQLRSLVESHDFIEINSTTITFPFSDSM